MKWYLKVLQNYANFEGRSRRKEYWIYLLFNVLIFYGLQTLAMTTEMPLLLFLFVFYAIGLLIPSLAVGVRRMHDVGKSGWYLLIPGYNLLLACTQGDHLDNQYGRNPKALEETKLQEI